MGVRHHLETLRRNFVAALRTQAEPPRFESGQGHLGGVQASLDGVQLGSGLEV